MLTMDAILLGGGLGTRYSEGLTPKQFQNLDGKPVFLHALEALLALDCFRQIVVVIARPYLSLTQQHIESLTLAPSHAQIRVVGGGKTRQESSLLGLYALEVLTPAPHRIAIHDACRPYLSKDFMSRVLKCLEDRALAAWVPIVPVTETLKRVEQNVVVETVNRENLFRVQTPQIFEYTIVRSLFEKTKDQNELTFTDDSSLCEYFGIPVGVFDGDVRNIKLTYPFEMEVLRALLSRQKKEISCEPESVTTYTV